MYTESTGRKIWNVIYPVLALFVLYFAVVYGGIFLFSSTSCAAGGTLDDYMSKYFSIVAAVGLIVVTIVEFIFFKNDYVVQPQTFKKKPLYLGAVIILGAAFSHGLNLLVSLFNINGIFDSYEAVEAEIFAPGVFFVILRAVILAPIAEELVFRGLVFRRMKNYTSFWPAALLSSVLFGLYHMNPAQGIYAFLFGIVLCEVYRRFQHLLAPILLHFAANVLSVILTYTNAAYPSQAMYVIFMVLSFAAAFAVYFFVVRKAKTE